MTAPSEAAFAADARDHRTAWRQRVLMSGKIVYGDTNLAIDCLIRNLSASGAKVRLAAPVFLPSTVHLIKLSSGLAFECSVAWRRMPELGLRIIRAYELHGSTPPELDVLKQIWAAHGPR